MGTRGNDIVKFICEPTVDKIHAFKTLESSEYVLFQMAVKDIM